MKRLPSKKTLSDVSGRICPYLAFRSYPALFRRPEVREVRCKTLLRRLDFGRGGLEYTANFYRGCTHGCVYCYAPSLVHDERRWGGYVDAKVNAPATLRRELREVEMAPVFLSSASDPYQPVEARYRLTRRCLEELEASAFPVIILTRSPLVLRDLELLRGMGWVRVGCSISTASGRLYEPGVPPLERRLETLRALADAGVATWVSLAPVVPGIVTVEVEGLLSRLREAGVQAVAPGLLRLQGYDVSREMFERTTGIEAETALKAGQETIAGVRDAISRAGFKAPSDFFRWEGPRASPGLDEFAEGQAATRSSALPA
jgi:DNA repair photolyase